MTSGRVSRGLARAADPRTACLHAALEAFSCEYLRLYPNSHVERVYPSGAALVTQGFAVEHLSLVTAGMVKFWFITEFGEEVIAGLRLAPCLVGAESAILDQPSPTTASALTGCSVRQFHLSHIRTALKTNSGISFQLARSIAIENLRQLADAMEASSGKARQRLFRLLKKLGSGLAEAPSDPIPAMHLKKQEIAHLLGVTPEHLSRLLRTMESEGVLRREGSRLALTGVHLREQLNA
jgi:CRP/FNR family transcriptional regulator, dissimilatory nitrate respiration regulator